MAEARSRTIITVDDQCLALESAPQGVQVLEQTRGTALALVANDLVLALDDVAVTTPEAFFAQLRAAVGDSVSARLLRGGQVEHVRLEMAIYRPILPPVPPDPPVAITP